MTENGDTGPPEVFRVQGFGATRHAQGTNRLEVMLMDACFETGVQTGWPTAAAVVRGPPLAHSRCRLRRPVTDVRQGLANGPWPPCSWASRAAESSSHGPRGPGRLSHRVQGTLGAVLERREGLHPAGSLAGEPWQRCTWPSVRTTNRAEQSLASACGPARRMRLPRHRIYAGRRWAHRDGELP